MLGCILPHLIRSLFHIDCNSALNRVPTQTTRSVCTVTVDTAGRHNADVMEAPVFTGRRHSIWNYVSTYTIEPFYYNATF
jgi:hypothetical protein